jgi:ring-1,2-phenylacetyl-CoA epoxidase subunit PaaE
MASLITRPAQRRGRFHTLTVTHLERLTDEAVAVSFAIPVQLAGDYRFEPGQHVTLRANVQGQRVQRSYSICLSRPEALQRKEIRVAAARVDGGLLSNWINDSLGAGDQVEVMTPLGEFTCATQPELARHHVAIVAGSGITPVMSLFSTALHEEPESRATLIFGNRQTSSVMFRQELADLEASHPGRFHQINVFSREAQAEPLLNGRLDRERLERILADMLPTQTVDEWYLCGPAQLVEAARGLLADRGVEAPRVHYEVFDTDQ